MSIKNCVWIKSEQMTILEPDFISDLCCVLTITIDTSRVWIWVHSKVVNRGLQLYGKSAAFEFPLQMNARKYMANLTSLFKSRLIIWHDLCKVRMQMFYDYQSNQSYIQCSIISVRSVLCFFFLNFNEKWKKVELNNE